MCTFSDCRVDLAILLDRSGSICNDEYVTDCRNWQDALAFVVALVEGIDVGPDGARVSLTTFDNTANIQWSLSAFVDNRV